MPLTSSQFVQIQSHPALDWLRDKVARNQAVGQDIIKLKITEAINSKLVGRATEDNIRDVANRIKVPYGNVFVPPVIVEGYVHPEAVAEVEGTDSGIAEAAKMIFNGTAGGRTSPGTTGINHIHAGGNAHVNVLFDATTYVIYGVVYEHMEGGLSNAQRQVMGRKGRGGNPVKMRVVGNSVTRG
jgi:hypothetical protein